MGNSEDDDGEKRRVSKRNTVGEYGPDRSSTRSDDRSCIRSDPVASLHRSVGNRAVKELHESGTLMAKRRGSRSTDRHEREADRTAEEVVSSGRPSDGGTAEVQRSTTDEASGDRTVSGESEEAVRSIRGGGRPMDGGTRSFFESRMGADFSDVRVHTGGKADEAARSINAEAFTAGTDVAFASGNYDPGSSEGKRLIAHELTHVVQQRGGGGSPVQRQESEWAEREGDPDLGPLTTIVADDANAVMAALRGEGIDPTVAAARAVTIRENAETLREGIVEAARGAEATSEPGLAATLRVLDEELTLRSEAMAEAVSFLRAYAKENVSPEVLDVIDGLDLSDEQKRRLLEAIVFPVPRPDLSREVIYTISDPEVVPDWRPEEGLDGGDRDVLLAALEHPQLSRDDTNVPDLERRGREGGGYAAASEENLEAFRNKFREVIQSHVPDNLDISPDDLLKQSSDLREQHPEVGENTEPLELPPKSIWDNMTPTLELIGEIGSLVDVEFSVESTYRSELVNALAGGATGSAHMTFAGMDIEPDPADQRQFGAFIRLFWQEHADEYSMGLGFYGRDRMHIDTLGSRRWGLDSWAGERDDEGNWETRPETAAESLIRFRRVFPDGVNSLDDLPQ